MELSLIHICTITYTYGADGTKLRTVHKIGSTTTTTDYCGTVIYENGVQKLLLTEEGYITLRDSKYHYYLKDHQGNNRVVISQSGTVEEKMCIRDRTGASAYGLIDNLTFTLNGNQLSRMDDAVMASAYGGGSVSYTHLSSARAVCHYPQK